MRPRCVASVAHVRCPACGEWVLARAKRCQYCSQSLTRSNLSSFVPETTAEEADRLNSNRLAPDGHREVDLDQPIRVLLVDDILEVRERVRAMLHKAGEKRGWRAMLSCGPKSCAPTSTCLA